MSTRNPKGRKPPTLRKGPVKQSKRVLDRVKAADELVGAIDAQKERVAAGVKTKLGEVLHDGETAPDLTLTLELTGRSVAAAIDLLVRADAVYCKQGNQRKMLNEACILVAREEVYPELVNVRRSIEMRFGREAGRQLHRMRGNTRRKPKRQVPQLEKLVGMLRQLEEKGGLPPSVRPGPFMELRGWLQQLEPGYEKLTEMLAEIEDRSRMEEALRKDRDFELESFDIEYGEALAFVRAAFQLGGLSRKVIRGLLPPVQRRRLKRKARRESEARAEGRRGTKGASSESPEE